MVCGAGGVAVSGARGGYSRPVVRLVCLTEQGDICGPNRSHGATVRGRLFSSETLH